MPNWVPQSPIWLSLMTRWPRNRSTRHKASPITVERMCPTCIGLATLGAEKSITKVRGLADRRDAQPRIAHRRRKLLDQSLVFDPQIDEARAGDLRRLAEVAEIHPARSLQRPPSRGGRRNRLPNGMAKLAW